MDARTTLAALCLIAFAAEARAIDLTLGAAVDMAIARSPSLAVAAARAAAADARLHSAIARALPSIEASETFLRSDNPVFVFGSLLEQGRFGAGNLDVGRLNDPGPIDDVRSEIGGRIALFDRLGTPTALASARLDREQAADERELALQRIRVALVRAYFGVVVARARRDVADESVRMAEAETRRIGDLHAQRMVTEADLAASAVQLAEFRQQQIAARGDVAEALAALNTIVGWPLDTTIEPTVPLASRPLALPPQEDLLADALERRPDYLQAARAVRQREQDVIAAYGQYLPQIDVSGGFGRSSAHLDGGNSDFRLGARMSLGLFDAQRESRVAEARAARAAAEAERRRREDEVCLEVVRAVERHRSARARAEVAERALEQARLALRIVEDRYDVGLTTITELLRAQSALVRARTGLIGARYDAYVGYAEALRAGGILEDLSGLES